VTLAVLVGLGSWGAGPAAAATSETLWGSGTPAGVRTADDSASVELGTAFTVKDSGTISGVRYWRGSAQAGTQTGALWSDSGQRLATATVPSSSQTGWQQASFSSPVKVDAGDSFVVSYHSPSGEYAFTPDYHGASTSSALSISSSNAGRYAYSSSTTFPTRSYRSTNYWVTPVYNSSSTSSDGGVAPAPAPDPTPTPSGKPGSSNTGVPDGTTLSRYTGPSTITTAGTVIDSKDITQGLTIRAKNVVIRNSKIHDDQDAIAGVYVDNGGSATITDSEIYNVDLGITYGNWTATRVDIHDTSSDGVKMSSNAKLQSSWIHNPKPSSGAHWDGVQVQNGVVNTTIAGSTIDARGSGSNSALFLTPDLGPSSDGPLTVTGNWLDGGNFTLYALDGDNGRYYIDNISVTNNRFGRGAAFGPTYVNVPVTWSGNVWDDTGRTVGH
jgi:hypothetical protein